MSTEVRTVERLLGEWRNEQSNQKEFSRLVYRRVRSVASDLLRHQIWPLAFCRARYLLYIGESHSLASTSLNLAARHDHDGDTLDMRPPPDSLSPFAYLLTYLRSDGRPAGSVIMTRRHASSSTT